MTLSLGLLDCRPGPSRLMPDSLAFFFPCPLCLLLLCLTYEAVASALGLAIPYPVSGDEKSWMSGVSSSCLLIAGLQPFQEQREDTTCAS